MTPFKVSHITQDYVPECWEERRTQWKDGWMNEWMAQSTGGGKKGTTGDVWEMWKEIP